MVLSHRPTREGSTVTEAHVPAYLASELATTAFADALPYVSDGVLEGEDVVIAHLEASFGRELVVGDVDVVLRKVGRSFLDIEVTWRRMLLPQDHSGSYWYTSSTANRRQSQVSSGRS